VSVAGEVISAPLSIGGKGGERSLTSEGLPQLRKREGRAKDTRVARTPKATLTQHKLITHTPHASPPSWRTKLWEIHIKRTPQLKECWVLRVLRILRVLRRLKKSLNKSKEPTASARGLLSFTPQREVEVGEV
jgi:hypothetical protein